MFLNGKWSVVVSLLLYLHKSTAECKLSKRNNYVVAKCGAVNSHLSLIVHDLIGTF